MKEVQTEETCCYNAQHSSSYGKTFKRVCGNRATHTNGQHFFCRHHSKTGRFVFRVGDVGEIKARFDTKEELLNNRHLFPGLRMQKLTKSNRSDIYPKP